jgi:DNA-binding PucR family transcriptional regulator
VALGYRLRQRHVGVVVWLGAAFGGAETVRSLHDLVVQVGRSLGCDESPLFVPRDESSAWAWLPLGFRDRFDSSLVGTAGLDGDIRFAFGGVARDLRGFCLTHEQAAAAQGVALAAGVLAPRVVAFAEVAPVAMMLGSAGLLRAWVLSTLAGLAIDDEHHARLRDTLLVFLQAGGSYKITAEQLTLHKNTVQYRIRKAQESLGRPVGDSRNDVELALLASQWLGSSVLERAAAGDHRARAY